MGGQVKEYRKRPIVIKALQLRWDTWSEMCDFAGVNELGSKGCYIDENNQPTDNPTTKIGMIIPTLEGTMIAIEGDYIIRGIKGEFYSCKPDIFEATYEEV